MVKPWLLDTTLWKVYSVGREIRDDWLVIQKCLTDSNVLAQMIRRFPKRVWKTGHPYSFAHLALTLA